MKLNDSTRSYLGHLLEIKDDITLNELITSFNQTLAENTVQALNVRKTFTTKGDRFWICDDGLVLCNRKWYIGANTWAKLEGKYTYCVQTRNELYGYLGLV
jgi:hypothetical protein